MSFILHNAFSPPESKPFAATSRYGLRHIYYCKRPSIAAVKTLNSEKVGAQSSSHESDFATSKRENVKAVKESLSIKTINLMILMINLPPFYRKKVWEHLCRRMVLMKLVHPQARMRMCLLF